MIEWTLADAARRVVAGPPPPPRMRFWAPAFPEPVAVELTEAQFAELKANHTVRTGPGESFSIGFAPWLRSGA